MDRVERNPQMEWRDTFETHFEWKHVHSLHSLGANNRPMFITFLLTHPGRLRAELRPQPGNWQHFADIKSLDLVEFTHPHLSGDMVHVY